MSRALRLATAASVIASLFAAQVAYAEAPAKREEPYDRLIACAASVLTPQEKETSFTVSEFSDSTAKFNYVADGGTGAFLGAGGVRVGMTTLDRIGVTTVNTTAVFQGQVSWTVKLMGPGSVKFMNPDYEIGGTFSSLDINYDSDGKTLRIGGIGGTVSNAKIMLGLEIQVTTMPDPTGVRYAGVVVASDSDTIVMSSRLWSIGATTFAGLGGSQRLFEVDFGEKKTDPIQLTQTQVIRKKVTTAVLDVFGKRHLCQAQIEYGDALMADPTRAPLYIASSTSPKADRAPALAASN